LFPADSVVYVVDDDPSVRDAISSLLRSTGLVVQTFATARDFMRRECTPAACCLILDVRLPEIDGFDLQRDIAASGLQIPIIFLTGHGTIPMTVQAMRAGAAEFLTKPFVDADLLLSVRQALAHAETELGARVELSALQERYASLTNREQEIADHVIAGKLNKQIAAELGLSEITVKVHRRRLLEKLGVRSVADLVRIGEKLCLSRDPATGKYTKV
jgi:FixJ family two-component response regulator